MEEFDPATGARLEKGNSIMTVGRWSRIVALLALFGLASLACGQTPDSPDGLVKIAARRMELAWLRPGADFRPYTKVIIDPTQVAFRPDWRKDYNLNASVGNWVSQEQADKIMAAARTNFDEIFRDAFRKAGYEVVTAPGPGLEPYRVAPLPGEMMRVTPTACSRRGYCRVASTPIARSTASPTSGR